MTALYLVGFFLQRQTAIVVMGVGINEELLLAPGTRGLFWVSGEHSFGGHGYRFDRVSHLAIKGQYFWRCDV